MYVPILSFFTQQGTQEYKTKGSWLDVAGVTLQQTSIQSRGKYLKYPALCYTVLAPLVWASLAFICYLYI